MSKASEWAEQYARRRQEIDERDTALRLEIPRFEFTSLGADALNGHASVEWFLPQWRGWLEIRAYHGEIRVSPAEAVVFARWILDAFGDGA